MGSPPSSEELEVLHKRVMIRLVVALAGIVVGAPGVDPPTARAQSPAVAEQSKVSAAILAIEAALGCQREAYEEAFVAMDARPRRPPGAA